MCASARSLNSLHSFHPTAAESQLSCCTSRKSSGSIATDSHPRLLLARAEGLPSSRAGRANVLADQAVRLSRQRLAGSKRIFPLNTPAVALLEGRPEIVGPGGPVTAATEKDRTFWARNIYRSFETRFNLNGFLGCDDRSQIRCADLAIGDLPRRDRVS